MAERAKVSIVLPVYKVEGYIEKCIKSLQNQTLSELEMIFVDDCGGDDSIHIVEEYAKKDSRIKILYNEENMGAGKSRNKGIDAATGEFLAFVDPDDWVDENFYEVLYNKAKEGNYDIVKGRRVQVTYRENGEIRYKESPVNNRIKSGMTQMQPLYRFFTAEHQTAIFNCDMIHEHKVYNGSSSHSENSVFLLGASYYAKSFCIDGRVAYYYFQREDSSVHVFDYKKFSGELLSFQEQMQFLNSLKIAGDNDYIGFLGKKIGFLMRRYNELKDVKELRGFCKEFVTTLEDELDAVKNKKNLGKYGYKTRLLLNHKTGKFMMVSRFDKVFVWAQNTRNKLRKKASSWKKKMGNGNQQIKFDFDFSKTKLIYLQNHRGCILFTEKFLEVDPQFAKDYINAFMRNNENYNNNLSVDSEVYQEHLELMKEGELCWRYTKRFGAISKTTISLDADERIYFRGDILGSADVVETEHFIIHPQANRNLIAGNVLRDYIVNQPTRGELKGELRQYIDYIFDYFKTDDDNYLSGMSYDAFPYNCILTENHTYELFDLEFEYKHPVEKGYMLYKVVRVLPKKKQKPVYFDMCELYGLVPKWDYWDDFNFNIWLDTISEPDDVPSNAENKKLFARYFI